MDPRLFLTLAERLIVVARDAVAAGGNAPAECRSAVSRAYYAAFLVSSAFVDSLRIDITDRTRRHILVQYALNYSRDSTLQAAYSHLSNVHSARLIADYDMGDRTYERVDRAEFMVQSAREVIALLDALRTTASTFDSATARATILATASATQQGAIRGRL